MNLPMQTVTITKSVGSAHSDWAGNNPIIPRAYVITACLFPLFIRHFWQAFHQFARASSLPSLPGERCDPTSSLRYKTASGLRSGGGQFERRPGQRIPRPRFNVAFLNCSRQIPFTNLKLGHHRLLSVANENLMKIVGVFRFFHVRICNRFEKKPVSYQPNDNIPVFLVAVGRKYMNLNDNLS